MSNYRDINKELVDQVQAMRRNMKLYCDEIIHLKEELFQKRESEIILRKKCYNWAVNNFIHFIQFVQPDCDILPVLKEHVHSQGQTSSTSSFSTRSRTLYRSRTSGEERLSDAPRNSSPQSILMELQRSNSIINIRRSMRSTSPIRNSKGLSDDDEVEEQTSESDQMDIEVEENRSSQPETLTEPLQNFEICDIIYEELLEDDEEVAVPDLDSESVYESIEQVCDNSQLRRTLRNITNTVNNSKSSEKENCKTKNVNIRGRHRKKLNYENTADEYTPALQLDNKERRITRNKSKNRISLTENEENSSNPEQNNPMLTTSQDILQYEVALNSPTLVATDMTGNIKDAACSTPNSLQNSQIKLLTPPELDTVVLSDSEYTITRPSRRCKPKDLSEPKLGTKLRSTETKSKRYNSRSKNKKIV